MSASLQVKKQEIMIPAKTVPILSMIMTNGLMNHMRERNMKLIDRDELLAVIEDDMDVSITGKKNMEAVKKMMQNILDDVKESPVVDAVQVIRCKDCKHYTGYECQRSKVSNIRFITNEDDYCSRAERREE